MSREEAYDLFRKWLSEGTSLDCSIRLPILETRFRVRLRTITPEGDLKLSSDDNTSELSLYVLSSAEFGYTEGADIEAPDRFEGILVIILRKGTTGKADTVTFTEVSSGEI